MIKKRKNKYNHYTEDFRREAVRRSEQDGVSVLAGCLMALACCLQHGI